MPLIDDSEFPGELAALLGTRPAASLGTRPQPAPGPAPIAVPGALAGRRTLATLPDILNARRSVREFRQEPLELDDLEFVIRHATAALRTWWPAARRPDHGLTVLAAAFDVTGMNRGIHAPGPDATFVPGPGLCEAAQQDWLPELRDLYAPASVFLLICGDVGWAASPAGPGYGGLLTEAGALGYALWLAALSAGLAGSVYGGTCHQVTETASRHRPGLQHLFTFAAGRADGAPMGAAAAAHD